MVTVAKPSWLVSAVVVVSLLVPLVRPGGPAGADTVGDQRARAAVLAARLSADNVRSEQLAEAYDKAQIHLQAVEADLVRAKAQLGQTGAQLSGARAKVRDLAVRAYMDGGAARQLSLLIPGSATEVADRSTYVAAATGSANNAIDSLRAAHVELSRQQAVLAGDQAAAARATATRAAASKAAREANDATAAAYAQAQAQLGQTLLTQAQQATAAANQARLAAAAARGGRVGGGGGGGILGGLGGLGRILNLPAPSSAAGAAIGFAQAELGKPYVYGGGGPSVFDCSGLTAWAWGHAGHPLPHLASAQYDDTTHVSVAQLQPGDLVFYGSPPHHVGLYVGNGQMINALHSGTNVEYDTIFLEGDLIGGGRVN